MADRVAAPRPSLDEIRTWPPTVSVTRAALALGVSRALAYRSIDEGKFPVETVKVGKKLSVLTVSLIRVLQGKT